MSEQPVVGGARRMTLGRSKTSAALREVSAPSSSKPASVSVLLNGLSSDELKKVRALAAAARPLTRAKS